MVGIWCERCLKVIQFFATVTSIFRCTEFPPPLSLYRTKRSSRHTGCTRSSVYSVRSEREKLTAFTYEFASNGAENIRYRAIYENVHELAARRNFVNVQTRLCSFAIVPMTTEIYGQLWTKIK